MTPKDIVERRTVELMRFIAKEKGRTFAQDASAMVILKVAKRVVSKARGLDQKEVATILSAMDAAVMAIGMHHPDHTGQDVDPVFIETCDSLLRCGTMSKEDEARR